MAENREVGAISEAAMCGSPVQARDAIAVHVNPDGNFGETQMLPDAAVLRPSPTTVCRGQMAEDKGDAEDAMCESPVPGEAVATDTSPDGHFGDTRTLADADVWSLDGFSQTAESQEVGALTGGTEDAMCESPVPASDEVAVDMSPRANSAFGNIRTIADADFQRLNPNACCAHLTDNQDVGASAEEAMCESPVLVSDTVAADVNACRRFDFDDLKQTITDADVWRLNSNNNNFNDDFDDSCDNFLPPVPVSTSTPVTFRPDRTLKDSLVNFPKLDLDSYDSGLGETLNFSPSMASIVSPSISDVVSPIAVANSEADSGFSTLCASVTGDTGEEDSESPLCASRGQISSTPIFQLLMGPSSKRPSSLPVEKSLWMNASGSPASAWSTSPDCNLYSKFTDSLSPTAGSHCGEPEELDLDEYINEKWVDLLEEHTDEGAELVRRFREVIDLMPKWPAYLIGRNIGVEYMDIISELHDRDVPSMGIIAWLTPYISSTDFIRMGCVCRQWRYICQQNTAINKYHRLCSRFYNRSDEKENGLHGKYDGHGMTRASHHLGTVQRTVPVPTNVVFSSPALYEQARQTLRWTDIMYHCPFCHSVAKAIPGEGRGRCQNPVCQADFCSRCLCTYHHHRNCPAHSAPREVPGTRKSKKNLKRISHL